MNSQKWAEIEIEAESDAVDAVGHILSSSGCNGFRVKDDAPVPIVLGYLPMDDRLEDRLYELKASLLALPDHGITTAGSTLVVRNIHEADWANAWKEFYKPIPLGRTILVTPPWEDISAYSDRVPVIVDPGMAFGTGSHPTTQLCLVALEDYLRPGEHVADIGTGSGILAIAAKKLGANYVVATDIDPLAVSVASENCSVNSVEITVQHTEPDEAYDLVVANILADVIIDYSELFANIVKPNGVLIASGIIDTRENDVRFAVEGFGFSPLETRRQGEWVALIFRRNSN